MPPLVLTQTQRFTTSQPISRIALAISTDNYPGEKFAPTLALYLLVCTVLAIRYVKWQRSRSTRSSGTP